MSTRILPPRRRTHVVAAALLLLLTSLASVDAADATTTPDRIKVNFQPEGAAVPDTYVADSGHAYDAGRGYGWLADDGSARQCTERHTDGSDRGETFCHATMQYRVDSGYWTPVWSPATWRADLAPGLYDVTVTVGDRGYHHPEILHAVQVNGHPVIEPTATDGAHRMVTATERLHLDDGLHLSFWGGNDTKLIAVKAIPVDGEQVPTTEAPLPPAPTPAPNTPPVLSADDRVKVNFQPARAPEHRDYDVDAGAAYDVDRGYGWHLPDGIDRQCADRGVRDNQQVDTTCRATTRWTESGGLVQSPASWSADAANGTYDVTVTVGDVGTSNAELHHSTQVNGVVVQDRVRTTTEHPIHAATVRITVTDGRFDVTFNGGSDTRIMSFKAVPAGESAPTTEAPLPTAPTEPTVPTTEATTTTTEGQGEGEVTTTTTTEGEATTTTTQAPTTTTTTQAPTTTTTEGQPEPGAPVIDVWEGLDRRIGNAGVPQRFVNVQGNVSDDGAVTQLVALLNGDAPRELRIGATDRRLIRPGDFNLDVPVADLVPGRNRVVLVASDDDGNTTSVEVRITYEPIATGPSVAIDWSQTAKLDDVGHAVDGDWRITDQGVRTVTPGYDRIIAIGDLGWQNYEATTSIIVHSLTPDQFEAPSFGAGVGVVLHWTGHSTNPGGRDPLIGFLPDGQGNVPFGAITWIQWQQDVGSFARILDSTTAQRRSAGFSIEEGQRYFVKAQVEDGRYRWRIWAEGQDEPTEWQTITANGVPTPGAGSLGLIAHEADVTFGDVIVRPLG